jgi:transglutaminase/protease-like cytokinesis protein 3
VQVGQVMNQALSAVKEQCEQLYNAVSCTYDLSSGRVRLLFSCAGTTSSELKSQRSFTLDAAIAVHDALWKNGEISSGMSEYDKAKVYYAWVCENCTYDYGADDTSLSHTAYNLFKNGTAVCDGYTGAYNLLLKLEGIDCYALANYNHIWTVAVLDGTQVHIDTTWGDAGDGVDYTYFAMTAQQAWSIHSW